MVQTDYRVIQLQHISGVYVNGVLVIINSQKSLKKLKINIVIRGIVGFVGYAYTDAD